MRLAVPIALLACAVARADVSLDARAAGPHTPYGAACDAALAAAQARFTERSSDVHFRVREQRIVGEYEWSDMCGVWGNYSLVIAPDHRPAHGWSWRTALRDNADEHSAHRRGNKRGGSLRAEFILDADEESDLGDWFVEAFQPAVDVCLASAARPR
jgi:hypothetical protein